MINIVTGGSFGRDKSESPPPRSQEGKGQRVGSQPVLERKS